MTDAELDLTVTLKEQGVAISVAELGSDDSR